MPIIVTAAKGGSGATTIASSIVLAGAHATVPTLVDLAGDAAAAFRTITRPESAPTVDEWLLSAAPTERLDELAQASDPPVLAWGHRAADPRADPARSIATGRWAALLDWCGRRELATGSPVVIDAGPRQAFLPLHASGEAPTEGGAGTSIVLVTRPCYLAVRRAARLPRPDGVVVVDEPGRALTRRDIERSVGAPVIATLGWDPAVARAIDAGLTCADAPRSLRRCGSQVIRALGSTRLLAA